MAYGPVNVPGGAGMSQGELASALRAAQEAASDAQAAAAQANAALENLEKAIQDGTITVNTKPVFPVVEADPESPAAGEAWILKA